MTGTEKAPTHHLSEISIHSKDDNTIPYAGTDAYKNDHWIRGTGLDWLGFHALPAEHTQSAYRAADGITSAPVVIDKNAPDGTKVHIEDSKNAREGTEVMQVTVEKRDHGWFGSSDSPGALSATDTVVDFLLSHKRVPNER